MFIDIHTHQQFPDSVDEIHLFNIILKEKEPVHLPTSYFTAGIHPWFLPEDEEQVFRQLEELLSNPRCLAVGECGIDWVCKSPKSYQEKIFIRQIALAEKYHKPIMLHVVRAFPEIIRLKKSRKKEIPWIIHGFLGNEAQREQLSRHDFYFSIGMPALSAVSMQAVIPHLPQDHLFIETDESNWDMEKIGSELANRLQIPPAKLKARILSNFQNIFLRNSILYNI